MATEILKQLSMLQRAAALYEKASKEVTDCISSYDMMGARFFSHEVERAVQLEELAIERIAILFSIISFSVKKGN